MKVAKKEKDDYDSPWKEALERYFKDFIALFFPEVYDGIDWTKSCEFLDKELQKTIRKAKIGRRLVDKLVKVHKKNSGGDEAFVLVHAELQAQKDPDFEKRMYIYNYRLFDRYDRQVASLAIFADQDPAWKPKNFQYDLWGCRASLEFPVVKLRDLKWSDLEASRNPFSIIVMAHLKAQATTHDPDGRSRWKVTLFKMLHERGYNKEDILELYRFIDWLMILPKALERKVTEEMSQYEEEAKMPYVTSFERIGIQKGILQNSREDVIDVLETRFETVPQPIVEIINAMNNLSFLKALHKEAVKTPSLEAFEQALEKAKK